MDTKTLNLHITNFVRPFTVSQARSLLEETCKIEYFWMDSIKSQCFVTVSTSEEAEATFKALQDRVWPTETGKALKVAFVPNSELPKQGDFSR